jgi:hypothetical protein
MITAALPAPVTAIIPAGPAARCHQDRRRPGYARCSSVSLVPARAGRRGR